MKSFAWVAVYLIANQALIGAAQERDDHPRELRLQRMGQIAERVDVTIGKAEKPLQLPLVKSPLLRFSDPTREFHDATLWAWGDKGRPACLLAIEQYGNNSHFEFISLTDGKLSARVGDSNWSPESSGLTLRPFPTSSTPAGEAPRRLGQMKELVGKLSAHEIQRNGKRFELRRLPTLVHRYGMPSEQVLDGAIFVFANGTNPELLVVVEACGEVPESAKWQIGFARCGGAELHVLLDDAEFFKIDFAGQTHPTDAYWIFEDPSLEKGD